jgi:hypothetical protein
MDSPTVQKASGDKSPSRSASTEQAIFYVRCNGDGSWLGTDGKWHLPEQGGHHWEVAKLTMSEVQRQGYSLEPWEIYYAIDSRIPLGNYVLAMLEPDNRATFAACVLRMQERCPFVLERFEAAAILTKLVKDGKARLVADPRNRDALQLALTDWAPTTCALCESPLESHGDCSNKDCDTHKVIIRVLVHRGIVTEVDTDALPEGVIVRVIDTDTEQCDKDEQLDETDAAFACSRTGIIHDYQKGGE